MADPTVSGARFRALTCVHACWSMRWGWCAAPLGLVIGILAYVVAGHLLAKTQPTAVEIHQIDVVDAPAGVEHHALQLELTVPPAKNCTRLTQQLLYRDVGARRFYYPLGSAINGMGFAGSRWNFVLVLPLPPGLQPGDYQFVQRSIYTCSWLGGFVQQRIAYQTPDHTVHIAD